MNQMIIDGGTRLRGEIGIQGSKNAALPILAACVLHKGTTVLHHCPRIQDVWDMVTILETLGASVAADGASLTVDASVMRCTGVPKEAGRIRSSLLFLGSLTGRMREAQVPHPGGCRIGQRPVDLHVEALRALGAGVTENDDILTAQAARLRGAAIHLGFPSVGATENAVLAAVLADGVTRISGAAREPEIAALCDFLNGKGARISGAGTDTLVIDGVECLTDSEFTIPGDRIVAGTYLLAAMLTGGEARIRKFPFGETGAVLETAQAMGATLRTDGADLLVSAEGGLKAVQAETAPYPGFPTDLQSQLMAAMAVARGESRIRENVFEDRFHIVHQLRRMGAKIEVDGRTAVVFGRGLHGADVEARELRGGAALVLAALAAEGTTRIAGGAFIRRGYEDICRDLGALGARIREQEITDGGADAQKKAKKILENQDDAAGDGGDCRHCCGSCPAVPDSEGGDQRERPLQR